MHAPDSPVGNMDERDKLRAAVAKLGEVIAGIVATAEEKNRERCPYRAVTSVCTYLGGCVNKKDGRCTGDEFVRMQATDRGGAATQ